VFYMRNHNLRTKITTKTVLKSLFLRKLFLVQGGSFYWPHQKLAKKYKK